MTSNLMALTMLLSGVLAQAPSVSIGDGVNPSFPTRLTIGDEYSIFLSNFPQVSIHTTDGNECDDMALTVEAAQQA